MPHISKKNLNGDQLDKLYAELIRYINKTVIRNEKSNPLDELLTRTEKIMLAKRFAVIIMLSQDVPQHEIYETLGMSPVTINLMSLHYENGNYTNILKNNGKTDYWKKIFDHLNTAGGLMQPKIGRGKKKI